MTGELPTYPDSLIKFILRSVKTIALIGASSNEVRPSYFVLKYLLGLNNVKNYDGSWTEYGNLVGAPIEKT